MQTRNRIFDDAAKLAGGAVGTLEGVRREIESLVRQQVERMLSKFDLVTRDEFEAVKEMAARARAEQDKLAKRLEKIEASQVKSTTAKKGSVRKKPKVKKA
ncbi:MAG: accessory factor UbiK family protein [Alphaproteobacteria bacterium]|nr:accessory factor UbiK family protein [Alphaproteobacteria bacterium]